MAKTPVFSTFSTYLLHTYLLLRMYAKHILTKNGKHILHGLNFFFRIYAFQNKSFISSITLEWHFKKKQVQKNVLKVL